MSKTMGKHVFFLGKNVCVQTDFPPVALNFINTVKCIIIIITVAQFEAYSLSRPLEGSVVSARLCFDGVFKPHSLTGGWLDLKKHGGLHQESSPRYRNAKQDRRCHFNGGDRLQVAVIVWRRAGGTDRCRLSKTFPDPTEGDPAGPMRTWYLSLCFCLPLSINNIIPICHQEKSNRRPIISNYIQRQMYVICGTKKGHGWFYSVHFLMTTIRPDYRNPWVCIFNGRGHALTHSRTHALHVTH